MNKALNAFIVVQCSTKQTGQQDAQDLADCKAVSLYIRVILVHC